MAKNIIVSNATELYAALKSSGANDTIMLKGGDYGSLNLSAKSKMDLNFEGVTIKSADASNPAVFTSMALTGVSNLTIEGVKFDYTFAEGDASYKRPFAINDSHGVTVRNSAFDGDVASGVSEAVDGFGTGYGLSVRGGSDIAIEGNDFSEWTRAAIYQDVENLKVTGNEIHEIRSDGFNFISITGALIENNYFHDFRAAVDTTDHRDMIQFWTNGTKVASSDIIIRSNRFDVGNGSYTQTIFMRNEEVDTGRAGKEMFYSNITIENNTIYNGHTHGISVGEVKGLVILGNSLIAVPDPQNPNAPASAVYVPSIRVASGSENVKIFDNLTSAIHGYNGQAGWSVNNNLLIQNTNPFAENYYGAIFISSSMDAEGGAHAYVALPGGVIAKLGVGSEATQAPEAISTDALFMSQRQDPYTWSFDASLTAKLLGDGGADATYIWTFGDGTTAKGKVVSHAFSEAKSYDVKLTVVLKSGFVITAGSSVSISGHEILRFDAATGGFIAHNGADKIALAPIQGGAKDVIDLEANSVVTTISRAHLRALYGSDSFEIDFALQADKAGSSGEIFRMHNSFIAEMTAKGTVKMTIFNQDGQRFILESAALGLNDGKLHDISFRVEEGKLKFYVDGLSSGTVDFSGTLPQSGSWDLSFGNPWGKQNFDGKVSDFTVELIADQPAAPAPIMSPAPAPTPIESIDQIVPKRPSGPATIEEQNAPGQTPPSEPPKEGNLFNLDIDALMQKVNLRGAEVVEQAEAKAVRFDGVDDFVDLGRFAEIDRSDRIAFSVDFSRSGDMIGEERLVWNHLKMGLSLMETSLLVQIATTDGFKAFKSDRIDLKNTDKHNITVMLDKATDQLQVLFDDAIVLNVREGVDFDFTGLQDRNWTIGTEWNRFFEGEVTDFYLSDSFDFVSAVPAAVDHWF